MSSNEAASSAASPDLDPGRAHEIVLMANLAIAQMEMAMTDATASVDVLAASFTGMYDNLTGIAEAAQSLPDSPVKDAILALGSSVSSQMQQAIMAFQFYDRLSQRLGHVRLNLEAVSGIVSDPGRINDPQAWLELRQQLRACYTMEDEKLMFDTIIATGDVKQAMAEFASRKQEADSGSDIELF